MATPKQTARVDALGSTLERVYEPKRPDPCKRLLKCCKGVLIALAACGCVALAAGWWQHEQLLAQRGAIAKEWDSKFDEQEERLKKLQRQVGKIVERTQASNSSLKLLLREAKQQQKEIGREHKRHHSKLDALISKLKIVNGTLTVRGRAKGSTFAELNARAKELAAGGGGASREAAAPKKAADDDDEEDDEDEKEESVTNKTSTKGRKAKKSKKRKRKKGGRG